MPQYTYLVQGQAAQVLNSDANSDVGRCQNMRLLLSRYVPQEVIMDESFREPSRNRPGRYDNYRYQDVWMDNTIARFDTRTSNRDWQAIQQSYFSRWLAMTDNPRTVRFEGELIDRMVVGLGGKGVLETGITLHHVTGLPIIPGSALKGMTRAYALFSIIASTDELQATDVNHLDVFLTDADTDIADLPPSVHELARNFRKAFGTTNQAGQLIFHDAVLSGWSDRVSNLFDIDIMNPHYPDYYRTDGSSAPSDDQNPVPVKLITVSQGVRFAFALSRRTPVNDTLFDTYTDYMVGGLTELGVGAKTRSGYGMFDILSN